MCSHYQALKERERYFKLFGVFPPQDVQRPDMWPGYRDAFVRRPAHADRADPCVPELEVVSGLFGLLPHWAKDDKLVRHTYNARSETAHAKPSFRDAWQRAQHCVVAAEAIFEPDWRSGKAVATRITRSDGQPLCLAALWSWCRLPNGQATHSFTLLTVAADQHPLARQFHKPGDEKRMVAVLSGAAWQDWLDAPAHLSLGLLHPCADDALSASPANAQA